LDDINPIQIGFLEETILNYDTMNLHTKRLIKLLPQNSPPFQLHIQTLFANNGESAKIIMIKCAKKNSIN
jgi:hypothetical protein